MMASEFAAVIPGRDANQSVGANAFASGSDSDSHRNGDGIERHSIDHNFQNRFDLIIEWLSNDATQSWAKCFVG